MLNIRSRPETLKVFLILGFSLLVLYLGFFKNYWRVADRDWFEHHQRDTESFIVGRMVMSHQGGILSCGGLTGQGNPYSTQVDIDDAASNVANQYLAYTNGLPFEGYDTYNSQIGGQGMFFSILDKSIPLSAGKKLSVFHALTSLFSAIALTAIVLWFYLEFGSTVAFFVLASVIFSQWLVVFGRNLWWSIWAFYLPMAGVMYYLRLRGERMNKPLKFEVIVFFGIFIKCLFTGYEYITTTLVMVTVPITYYGVLKQWNLRKFLTVFVSTAFSSCLAILFTFVILCFQISSVKGSFKDGVNHIVYSFALRTYANPHNFPSEYTASLESGTARVVAAYLRGTFFDANNYLSGKKILPKLYYYRLIILFIMMSGMLLLLRNKGVSEEEKRKRVALVFATWFSILAPLSWFIIFKAHSYIHTHMNFIVWQMPFVLFGFAICGLAVRNLLSGPHSQLKQRAVFEVGTRPAS